MEIQESFVLVRSELFSSMRQHCENCPDYNLSLQDLSDARVVTPTHILSKSRKRRVSQSIGCNPAPASLLDIAVSGPQPHAQLSGTGPSLQSDSESPQTTTAPSEPSAQSRSRPARQEEGKAKSRRTLALDRFIRHAPKGNKWRARQEELGLNTVERYEDVIQGFCRRTCVVSNRECRRELDDGLIAVGKNLAVLTEASLKNTNLQRSFAYFHVLILLSYCEVLRKKGVSSQVIDEIIQTVTDTRERDRKALLETIPWIHQLIVELVRKRWTLRRATELFFINAISISDLIWIRSDETFNSIIEHLSADDFLKCSYDDCLTPSYSIPGIIASLLNSTDSTDHVSLIELYSLLGYDLPELPSSVAEIYKVQPAKSAPARFENLTPDFFVADKSVRARQSLLLLFCALGTIPKFMLEQAISPQKRWNENGIEYQINPQSAQFDANLKFLFLDSCKLWQALEYLASLAAIGLEKSDGLEIYICSSTPAEYALQRSYWTEQALWLFCYTFPRNPETLPVSGRHKLSAVLDGILRHYAETGLELPSNDEVIETLLAVAKTGPLAQRNPILSLVDQLSKKTASAHLQAEAVYQRSVVLRLNGEITSSNQLLREFLNRPDTIKRLQSQPILGLLHLSQATNYAYNCDFSSASKEATRWAPVESTHTEKQLDVVWSQIHSAGRISRGQGHFKTACLFFERCLEVEHLRESRKHLALSYLVDTYIEVDYLQKHQIDSQSTGGLLYRAEKLIKPEVENLRSRTTRAKGYRRLLLSLSEIEIRQGNLGTAERLLMEVSGIYRTLVDPDIVDRLGHVRALIALARISPLSEAEARWNNALNHGRRYNPQDEEVFTVAFIHLFICVVRLRLREPEGAKAAFDYAASICRTKPPQFLIPGAGTFLFDDVQRQIEFLAGWKLPQHES